MIDYLQYAEKNSLSITCVVICDYFHKYTTRKRRGKKLSLSPEFEPTVINKTS